MKKVYLIIALFCVAFIETRAQVTIQQESFELTEANASSVYALSQQCSDGGGDYFGRFDNKPGTDPSNIDGSYYIAAEDVNGTPCSMNPQTITFDQVSISGYTDLEIQLLAAAFSSSSFDAIDYVIVEVSIDGGGWTKVGAFENDGASFNTEFREDADLDGTGEGTQLTSAFQDFTFSISGTGSTLDARIRVSVDAGGEAIALDNYRLRGMSACSGAPTGQATNLVLSGATDNAVDVNWTAGTGGDNYILVVKEGSTVSWTPSDATDYSGDVGGGSYSSATNQGSGNKVLYVGSATSATVTGLNSCTDYYFQVFHYCSSGNDYLTTTGTGNTGSQTTATIGASSTLLTAYPSSCPASGWTLYSVASNEDWSCIAGSRWEINGFGADEASDDWLISPAINLNGTTDEVLTFETLKEYTGPDLQVKYSTNYAGSGNPSTATWQEFPSYSLATTNSYAGSGNVDLGSISGTHVYIAFHYTSSGTGSGQAEAWRVRDVEVVGSTTCGPPGSVACSGGGDVTHHSFTANWGSVAGATGYKLTVFTNAALTQPLSNYDDLDVGNVTSYPVSGLAKNTTYYYSIKSYNGLGETSPTGSCNITTSGTVSCASNLGTDLIFSEYMEGSSNNKYIEIYNGTSAAVDLTNYKVELYANGSISPTNSHNLSSITSSLGVDETIVIYNSSILGAILSAITSNATYAAAGAVTFYNGDDALALLNGASYVDIIGRIGEDPGSDWSAGGNLTTGENTIRRKSTVTGGVTVNPSSGFPTLATEWDGFPQDNFADVGVHTMISGSGTPTRPTVSSANEAGTSFDFQITDEVAGGADYFYLDIAEDSTFNASTTYAVSHRYASTNVAASDTTITGLTPGGTYYIRARAFKDGCSSDNSPAVEVVLCQAPQDGSNNLSLTFENLTDNSADVSWTAPSDGADGYLVRISPNNNTWATLSDGDPLPSGGSIPWTDDEAIYVGDNTITGVTVTGLNASSTYYISLLPYNNCGGATNFYGTAVQETGNFATSALTSDQETCEDGNVTFTINVASEAGGPAYEWQVKSPDQGSFSAITDANGPYNETGVTYTGYDSKTLTISSANADMNGYKFLCYVLTPDACEVYTKAVTLTVHPKPGTPTIADTTRLCGNTDIIAAAAPANTTWYWQGTNAAGTSTAQVSTTDYNATTAGTYYLRARTDASHGECWSDASASQVVNLRPVPTATISFDGPNCGESSGRVVVESTSPTLGVARTFYLLDNSGAELDPKVEWTEDLDEYTFTGVPDGTYRAKVSYQGCTSANTSSVTVTHTAAPGDVTISDYERCGTGTVTVNPAIGTSGTRVEFSLDGNSVIHTDNAAPYNYTTPSVTAGSGIEVYARTANGTCYSDWLHGTVVAKTVSTAPTSASVSQTGFCDGDHATVTLSVSGGSIGSGGELVWYSDPACNPADLVGYNDGLVVTPPTPTSGNASASQTYYARHEDACVTTATTSTTITVYGVPSAPSTLGADNENFCVNEVSNIELQATGGGSHNGVLEWFTGSCGGTGVATGNNQSITAPSVNTTYYAYYRNPSLSTCVSSCANVTVNVHGFGGTAGLWIGAVSSDPTDCHNWDDGQLPSTATNVTVNSANYTHAPSVSAGQTVSANNLTIVSGTFEAAGSNDRIVNISGNLTIQNTGVLDLNDNTPATDDGVVSVGGHIDIQAGGSFDAGNSTLIFDGSANQNFTDASGTINVYNLEIDNGNEVVLNANLNVNNNVTLTNGLLTTDGYNVTISGGISGYGLSNYINMPSISDQVAQGFVTMEATTSGTTFPIGVNGEYTPVTITTAAGSHDFNIRVFPGVYLHGYSGISGSTLLNSTDVVNRTWEISPVSGSPTTNISLEWGNNVHGSAFGFNADAKMSRNLGGLGELWKELTTSGTVQDLGGGRYSIAATGINNYSKFGVGNDNSGLPVSLLGFEGELVGTNAHLNWTTVSERNNKGFEVQRSANGTDFERIAFVSGNHNSSQRHQYAYIDKTFVSAAYYRLKQIDEDGAFAFSDVIYLEYGEEPNVSISLYPNPTNGPLTLNIPDLADDELVSITIFNMQGVVVDAYQQTYRQVQQSLQNTLTSKPAGNYMLKIGLKTKIFNFKLIKE